MFVDSFQAGPGWSCSKAVYKHVWHIPLLNVQWINSWWWTEELSETRRVSCQNKFVKLVHLVGFIIKRQVWGVWLPVHYRYNNLSVMMQGEVGRWGREVLCDWQEMRAFIFHSQLFLCLIRRLVKEIKVYLHSDGARHKVEMCGQLHAMAASTQGQDPLIFID